MLTKITCPESRPGIPSYRTIDTKSIATHPRENAHQDPLHKMRFHERVTDRGMLFDQLSRWISTGDDVMLSKRLINSFRCTTGVIYASPHATTPHEGWSTRASWNVVCMEWNRSGGATGKRRSDGKLARRLLTDKLRTHTNQQSGH